MSRNPGAAVLDVTDVEPLSSRMTRSPFYLGNKLCVSFATTRSLFSNLSIFFYNYLWRGDRLQVQDCTNSTGLLIISHRRKQEHERTMRPRVTAKGTKTQTTCNKKTNKKKEKKQSLLSTRARFSRGHSARVRLQSHPLQSTLFSLDTRRPPGGNQNQASPIPCHGWAVQLPATTGEMGTETHSSRLCSSTVLQHTTKRGVVRNGRACASASSVHEICKYPSATHPSITRQHIPLMKRRHTSHRHPGRPGCAS